MKVVVEKRKQGRPKKGEKRSRSVSMTTRVDPELREFYEQLADDYDVDRADISRIALRVFRECLNSGRVELTRAPTD